MTSPSSAVRECPRCRAPLGDAPFCPRDGAITGSDRFVIGDRYVVEELIGGGGFAFVFGGRHLVLGKPVAIKVLRGEYAMDQLQSKRFLREARTASQLSHENIISILDFGRDDKHDLAYLVMERFAGVTLAEIIRNSAPIPPSRALPMLVQLARALGSAHAAGVLHRDVNPRNILVGRGDLIKLCDFGLSRSLAGSDRVTSAGAMIGTPAYMAPEQIRGEDAISDRVDVYGFGCTAYEMLSGKVPHGSGTPVALLANRLNDGTIEAIGGVKGIEIAAELEELVMACLASDPERRPSAADLESQLLAASAASGPGKKLSNPAGQMIGSYRVVKTLGRGGVSSVFLGEHPVIGTKVAIKVLSTDVSAVAGMAERFIQEARASSELHSPHIPRYYDFGFLDTGQPFAVMEYLDGETLGSLLSREQTLSVEDTAEIVGQVATAMIPVHLAGIVHRDLKPDNLFLTRDASGRRLVKILDFGIAKALAPGASATQTSLGLMLGTPYYCAPEQAMGLTVAPTADVYALGATAYEMLCGHPPFEGDVAKVLGAKTTREAPSLIQATPVPPVVAASVAQMIARDPAERTATMQDVVAALAGWRDTEPTMPAAAKAPRTEAAATPTPGGAVAAAMDDFEATGRTTWVTSWKKSKVVWAVVLVAALLMVVLAVVSQRPEREAVNEEPGTGSREPVIRTLPTEAPAGAVTPPVAATVPVDAAVATAPTVGIDAGVAAPPAVVVEEPKRTERRRDKDKTPKVERKLAPTPAQPKPRRDDAIIVDPFAS